MPSYGVIGNPVAQSLSPVLHSTLYDIIGYDGDYSRFLVRQSEIAGVIPAMKTLGISGINVTSPHKEAIIPYLDELSAEAREIGAVNTVRICEDGLTTGYNTDCHGFALSLLRAGIEIKGKSFAVCGVSGAGKAAYHALVQYGAAEIVTVSTRSGKGIPYSEMGKLPDMDAIINCTPLGMVSRLDESPVKSEIFTKFKAAVDMIYNPCETVFLKDARRSGLKTLNGLPMLVFQGIRSFELWTETEAPPQAADKIIERLACILREEHV